jgi:hypothetical protein
MEENMQNLKKTLLIVLAVLLAGILSSCGGSKETVLSGEERDSVLAYSEAKTDNLMAGLNAGDYAVFSRDFEQDMLNAMPQSGFEKMKKGRDAKLGSYLSRQVNKVTLSESGKFVAVIYNAVFEKDGAVSMRVVFRADDPHQVSGLWFNK